MTYKKPTYRSMDPKDLELDGSYQRPWKRGLHRRITSDFHPEMLGTLEISHRTDGSYVIFDGQHRWRAALELGIERLPCLVHEGLTPEQEAELFAALQHDRVAITAIESLRALNRAGKEEAVAVYETCERHGYKVGPQSRKDPNAIGTAGTLMDLFHDEKLDDVLAFTRQVWPSYHGVTTASFLVGVAGFLDQFGERLTELHKEKLSKKQPLLLFQQARSVAVSNGLLHAGNVTPFLVEEMRKVTGLRRSGKTLKPGEMDKALVEFIAEHPKANRRDIVTGLPYLSEYGLTNALTRLAKVRTLDRELIQTSNGMVYHYSVPAPEPEPEPEVEPEPVQTLAQAIDAYVPEEELIGTHPGVERGAPVAGTGKADVPNWARGVLGKALRAGWVGTRNGSSHYDFSHPREKGTFTVSSTPSDRNAIQQLRRDMMRIGAPV